MDIFYSIWSAVVHIVVGAVVALQVFFGGLASHTTVVVPPPTATKHSTTQTNLFPVAETTQKTARTQAETEVKLPEQKVPAEFASQKSSGSPQTFVQQILPSPAQTPTIATTKTPDQINTQTRAALVNILCTTKAGGYLHPISGSGVIIDGVGVILTNAHVGQYFLLRDYPTPGNVDCLVRTGSPAYPTYNAKLLYLPPVWVNANAAQIIAQDARGTGENDYSFLLITGAVGGSPLPSFFPAAPITFKTAQRGDPVLLASYPAGFLEGAIIQTSLYASSAFTTIADLFSFDDSGSVDLLSVGGTIISQAGSSGGAVVRTKDGALLGIIATDTRGATTASRDLRAITLSHIDRSLATQGQGGLLQILSGDLPTKSTTFNATVGQIEKQQLIEVLGK